MNELIVKNEMIEHNIVIEKMIYEVRGIQVMLDSDLAMLYQCKNGTKEINQAVKNNPKKFPERYSWILTDDESSDFLVKNFDQKIEKRGGRFKNPRVFAEQGVAMLATILHTDIAIDITIQIMDAFVAMRHLLNNNRNMLLSLNNINNRLNNYDIILANYSKRLTIYDDKLNKYDQDLQECNIKLVDIFSKFDKKEQILLKGQTYDAYISVLDILSNAEKEIIIIDNYADIKTLDLIRNIKYQVTLITKNSPRLSDIEIEKYNNQYHNLKVIRNNSFHNRYFIIDGKKIYLSGTSINNIGNNTSMIIKLEDESVKRVILQNVDDILSNNDNHI